LSGNPLAWFAVVIDGLLQWRRCECCVVDWSVGWSY